MSFTAYDGWWWPYLFILIAGWLATDSWRFIGVYFGGWLDETSEILVAVRAVATALVAAVIGNLIVFPSGALADAPLLLRIGAVAAGFAAYLGVRRSMVAGIVVSEIVLVAGLLLWPTAG